MNNDEINKIIEHHDDESLEEFAKAHLSKEKQAELKSILKDESKLKQILNSSAAKELMNKIRGNKNG